MKCEMATLKKMKILVIIAVLLTVAAATNTDTDTNLSGNVRNEDVSLAIEAMQNANYYTFVTLINIAPADLIQGNVTFLMPNDKTLASALTPESSAVDFLLLHAIPSPLIFENLLHFPTGSLIPTLKAEVFLRVTNNGQRQFFLNNVRITNPDICNSGSSIRCHGIDAVISQLPPNSCTDLPHLPSNTTSGLQPPTSAPTTYGYPPVILATPPTGLQDDNMNNAGMDICRSSGVHGFILITSFIYVIMMLLLN